MHPKVSVIIPTWNRRDLVVGCLRALAKQTFTAFEAIVADDGSTDDTVAVLHRDFPKVHVELLEHNRGFAAAVNAGIRKATGEWVFLLNNDVTLAPDCLDALVAAADAAMAAPLLLWRDDPGVIYSAGDRIRASGRPESIGFRAPLEEFHFPDRIFGVSAAAGLYRRSLFDDTGLLDERFIAYFEDSDLCFRARLAGFDAVFVPEAVATHIGSASIASKTWWRSAQCYRNHALLVLKNMPLSLLFHYGPAIAAERLHQARRLFSSARTEFGAVQAGWLLLRTWASLMWAVPHALRERHRIQNTRRMTPATLNALLTKGATP